MANLLATDFRKLHEQSDILLLPNAWDAASARIQVLAGAKAVATSSAALCWALGYPDGGALPVFELVAAIGRIARNLPVPLTVDIEDGYSEQPEKVADLAVEVRNAGAVGINIEDGDASSELLARKIQAIRARLPHAELYINARTDVYLRALAEGPEAIAMVVDRARVYALAGADGIFVPGLKHVGEAREIAAATDLVLNLMALPEMPDGEALIAAGVRRLSAGPALFRSAYAALLRDTEAFLAGRGAPAVSDALAYARMNELFA